MFGSHEKIELQVGIKLETRPGLGIHKRKKESKKTRKHALLVQENTALVQEKTIIVKKTRSRPRNRPRKKESFSFFCVFS